MKKLTYSIFALLSLSFVVNSQTVTTQAEFIDLHYAEFNDNGLGTASYKYDHNYGFTISFDGKGIELSRENTGDKERGKTTMFPFPKHDDKTLKSWYHMNIGKNIYLMGYSIHDNDVLKYSIFKVDCEGMKMDGNGVYLGESVSSKGVKQNYSWRNVNDKAILFIKTTKTENSGMNIELSMFDLNLKQLWKHEIKLPIENAYAIEDYYFQDENDFLISIKEVTGTGKKPTFKLRLFHFTDKMQNKTEYEIKLDNKFITDITLGYTKSGQIACAGLFSNKNYYSLSGCFYKQFDPVSKKAVIETVREFDADFNKSLYDRKSQSKNNDEDETAPDFDLRDIIFDENENMLLLAEDCYVYRAANNSGAYVNTYFYEDLIACGIAPNGEIKFNAKINKKQYFDYRVSESFALASVNGKWAIIFAQTMKSLKSEQAGEEIKKEFKENPKAPVLVLLDQNGKYTKEALVIPDKKQVSMKLYPRFIKVQDRYYLKFRDYKHTSVAEVKFK